MPDFRLPLGHYIYRPLKKGLSGWDVYALQTALKSKGHNLTLDGVFGPATDASVRLWQEGRGLLKDGIAGIATQRDLALVVGQAARDLYRLPVKLLMGQIESESAYILGNHTILYGQETPEKDDDSRDLGVAQINDIHKGVSWVQAFDVGFALDFLAGEIREKHDRYLNAPLRTGFTRVSNGRAWRLAAGSWNRPAHTAYLAGMRTNDPVAPSTVALSTSQREWIEGYMDRVCTYADDYYATRTWPS